MHLGQLIATLGVDSSGLNKASKDMKKFGREATKYLTLPLTIAGGASFKMYKDFESSMSKVEGLVGIARKQVQAWGDDVLRMAKDVGRSPLELADALYFVTSAGIRGAEAMDVLEMSAKASASGLGETKVIADLVTSAMNAYGSANLNAAQATDILVGTVREGKAQADALAGSMGMVLPIASAMGVSFDQVGAAIAAMTRTGTSAQTANMQMRQILNSLLKPTQQAAEALEDMGTSAAELRKIIREQGVLAALMKIRELTNKFGEDTMAKVFPNIRALSGVLDIMGKNLEDNKKIFDSLADSAGDLGRAFGVAAKTAEFKWNAAMASGRVAMVELGVAVKNSLLPIIESLTGRLANLAEWFKSLDDQQKKTLVTVAAILATVGPLAIILGFLVGNVLPGLVAVGMRVVKMLNLMKVAMLSNPVLAIAAAVATLAVGLAVLVKRSREAKQAQEDLFGATETAMRNTARQRTEIEQLFRIAQDETRSLKERKAAIEALNSISPTYLGNLNLETINTDKATEAKKKYIAELVREAKVKALTDELVKLEKRWFKEIQQLGGAKLSWHQQLKLGIISAVKGTTAAMVEMGEMGVKNLGKVEEAIIGERKEMEELLDTLLTADDVTKGLFGGGKGGGKGGAPAILGIDPKEVAAIVRRVKEETIALDTLSGEMGATFGANVQKASMYTQALMDLARLGVKPGNEHFDNYLNLLNQVESAQADLAAQKGYQDALQAMRRETKALADEQQRLLQMSDMLGNSFDLLRAQLDLAIQKFNMLWSQGLRPGNVELDAAIEKVKQLQAELQKQDIYGQVASAASDMAVQLGEAITGVEGTWRSMVDTVLSTSRQIIAELLKQAFLNLLVKGSTKGLAGLLAAAGGIGMLTGLWNKAKAKAASMQTGGEVPPGFPNDTYPAMLTSGEKVIPPNKLKDTIYKFEFSNPKSVGEDTYWEIKRVEERLSNS